MPRSSRDVLLQLYYTAVKSVKFLFDLWTTDTLLLLLLLPAAAVLLLLLLLLSAQVKVKSRDQWGYVPAGRALLATLMFC